MDQSIIVTSIIVVLAMALFDHVNGFSCWNYGNGCNSPGDTDDFYKDKFTEDCNKHDVCYKCAVTYRWNKRKCDIRFHQNMLRTCGSSRGHSRWCKKSAYDYYVAVLYFGRSHFHATSPSWCTQSWVSSCMYRQ